MCDARIRIHITPGSFAGDAGHRRRQGGFPGPALRRAPVLDGQTAAELVRLGMQIEALYGVPVDVEWTLCDGKLAIVQARPITTLPERQPSPLSEWPLPEPKGKYLRGSIVELLPDPLTPLFATLGREIINARTGALITDMAGGKPGAGR